MMNLSNTIKVEIKFVLDFLAVLICRNFVDLWAKKFAEYIKELMATWGGGDLTPNLPGYYCYCHIFQDV